MARNRPAAKEIWQPVWKNRVLQPLPDGFPEGPITIWKIDYTGKEKIRQDYQDTDFTKYLDWEL